MIATFSTIDLQFDINLIIFKEKYNRSNNLTILIAAKDKSGLRDHGVPQYNDFRQYV